MTGHRPRWPLATWLLVSHLAVGLAAVAILLLTGVLDRDLRWQALQSLRGQGHVWALDLQGEIETTGDDLATVATRATPRLAAARERTLVGLQVVDRRGEIVAGARPGHDTSLASAPEVRRALGGSIGEAARPRPSGAVGRHLPLEGPSRFGDVRLFVAVPIVAHDEIVGAVVVSRTSRAQVQALVQIGSPLAWRLVSITAIACLVALGAGALGGRSLRRLVRAAARIARGDGDPSIVRGVADSRVAEVAAVADAVEHMGVRLRRRADGAEAFAGHAAHELRTPIATLRGTLELLQDDPSMPAVQRERFLDNGIAELDRLDALVGALLDLGRAHDLHPAAGVVDLDDLVREAVAAAGVTVRGSAGHVRGHPSALRVVADNLLANARHHGGPRVEVELWATPAETGFAVHDDGPGIPPEVRARLFDRFFTTDRRRGVGLGLSVVQRLVIAHAGQVTVNATGGHTCFRIVLPRVVIDDANSTRSTGFDRGHT